MTYYNFEIHEQILIFCWRKCYCKSRQSKVALICHLIVLLHYLANGETRKSHFSLKYCISRERCSSWSVLHAVCCLPERKIVICDVFDSV